MRLMDFGIVSFTVFSEPNIACGGLSEEKVRRMNADPELTRNTPKYDSRAQIFDEMQGFIKLVFLVQTHQLLGAQIVCLDAAHLIAPLALAVNQRLDAHALVNVVFPYLIISEGIKALRSFQS